jgi:hypothetical protein
MKKESLNKIFIVAVYAIAMAFIETVVVVYLRKIYYPGGFAFPLKGFVEPSILGIEWVREFATIVMLLTVGILAGKKLYERFAYFIYAFAVWDIFYYIFLKILLNWPVSFFSWDLLFLIPWPWIGPVLAPILISVLMIIAAFLIIDLEDAGKKIKVRKIEWLMIILGVIIVLFTWMYDYGAIIFGRGFAGDFFTLTTNQQFNQIISNYSPTYYNWILFLVGLGISSLGIYLTYKNMKKKN